MKAAMFCTALLLLTVSLAAEEAGQKTAGSVANSPAAATAGYKWQQRATADLLQGRSSNSAVWTGKELIVFGGEGMGVSFGDGARYDLSEDAWQPLFNECGKNLPSERTSHSGVWTGRQMIIWGGFGGNRGAWQPSSLLWSTFIAMRASFAN